MTRRHALFGAALIGVAGAAATAAGFATAPRQAAFAYLTAWTFALSIALGALIFLMIGHATAARWTVVFQRFTEAVASSIAVLAVLFVPIALSLDQLYPWARPAGALDPEALARRTHQAAYLDPAFWMVRAVGFLASWVVIAALLARWGRRAVPESVARARVLSAVALPAVGLTLTFAAFDWLMSLTPSWYSTVFGLLYFSGGFIAALSLLSVVAWLARRVPAVAVHVRDSHTGALGRMMLAFLVFWAYMEFSQGVIIWIANKPDEVPWYVARGAGQWGTVFAALVIGHFAAPFLALLSRPLKRWPPALATIGGWLVVMHYVDVYWLVMPALHRAVAFHWLDLAAPAAVVGVAAAVTLAIAGRHPAIAETDPRFAAAVSYEGT